MKIQEMRYIYLILSLISLGFSVLGQNTIPAIGVYARGNAREMKYIEPSVSLDKSVISPPFEKPVMTIYIEKDRANVVLESQSPEFFFYFPDYKNEKPITIAEMRSFIKNYPFYYAKSIEDFSLIRMFDMKKGRAYRLEREKILSGYYKPMKEDIIEINAIPLSDSNGYKVSVSSLLSEGEYGFIYNKPTPYGSIVYDFRVASE